MAYGQAGLDGYFVVRRSYGGYAVVVVAAAVVVGMTVAVAVVVMIHQRPMLVGDEGARSMHLVVSEGGQRKGLDRRLTVTEEEHADEIGGFEAWRRTGLVDADEREVAKDPGVLSSCQCRLLDLGTKLLMCSKVVIAVARLELSSTVFVVAGMREMRVARDERFAVGHSCY